MGRREVWAGACKLIHSSHPVLPPARIRGRTSRRPPLQRPEADPSVALVGYLPILGSRPRTCFCHQPPADRSSRPRSVQGDGRNV